MGSGDVGCWTGVGAASGASGFMSWALWSAKGMGSSAGGSEMISGRAGSVGRAWGVGDVGGEGERLSGRSGIL